MKDADLLSNHTNTSLNSFNIKLNLLQHQLNSTLTTQLKELVWTMTDANSAALHAGTTAVDAADTGGADATQNGNDWFNYHCMTGTTSEVVNGQTSNEAFSTFTIRIGHATDSLPETLHTSAQFSHTRLVTVSLKSMYTATHSLLSQRTPTIWNMQFLKN